MRLKYSKLFTFLIISINVFLVFYTWKFFIVSPSAALSGLSPGSTVTSGTERSKPKDRIQTANRHIKKSVTIVFRDFYHFDNDLKGSIDSILSLIPNIQILIVYDEEPYPPLDYMVNYTTRNNVKFVNLGFDIRKTSKTLSPVAQVKTKFVLLLPDSVRLGGRSVIQKMLKELCSSDVIVNTGEEKNKSGTGESSKTDDKTLSKILRKMLIIPFSSNIRSLSNCCQIKLELANWTMEYSVKNGTDNCDMYLQKHAIFIETALLKEMPQALVSPFPEMFYIQAKVGRIKKQYLPSLLQDGKRLFTAFHNKQRKKEIRRHQFKEMYRKLQIKKVMRKVIGKTNVKRDRMKNQRNNNDGDLRNDVDTHMGTGNVSLPLITSVEYYGCEKNTKSCIGTVYNMKPFYVFLDKHTPPCCMEKLKIVFNHVLEEFENVGIRYWLDNRALRSATEIAGLSSDAYEIDISFNAFDLDRSVFLKKSLTRPLADTSGFYWIKATDGHYFRVQYSKMNRIGVNLLPFDVDKNHVVPSGFYGWKAKEFSSDFLHPMSTVVFLGKNIMCPNNVKEFLDLKQIK